MGEFESALEEFGLTSNEAKVYVALLEIGSTTSGALIAKTGLHIPRVYDALRGLIGKGLASFVIKNNKKHFEAVSPERLLEAVEEKRAKANRIIPQLLAIQKTALKKPEAATIFKGVKGIRTVLDAILDELKQGEGYADFGVSGAFREVMGAYWDAWQATKKKRRIKSRCIFEEKVRGSKLHVDYHSASKLNLAKFVPSNYHCPSDTMIYNDKIAIFVWTAKPPTAILIQDEATACGYKNIFEWMWKNAGK